MKSIDFNVDPKQENVFFTSSSSSSSQDKSTHKTHLDRCRKLPKKLIVRDLQHSWSDLESGSRADQMSMMEDNNNNNDDAVIMDEILNEDVPSSFSDDSSSSQTTASGPRLDAKLCLCRLQNGSEIVYISKFDMIEIEYKIKLGHRETAKANSFVLKYEFVDRNCHRLIRTSSKSTHKGFIKLT